MNKKLIRLTESDLHKIVKRSVNKVLRESYNDDDVYMSNYRDAMSDREDTYTIDDLFRELKEEGYDFLEDSHPNAWLPGNWMQVMQVAEELGYPEDIKELIIYQGKYIQLDSIANDCFSLSTSDRCFPAPEGEGPGVGTVMSSISLYLLLSPFL